jgi:hypothetical protein
MKRFILLMLLLTTPAAYASEYVNGVLVGPTSLTDPSGTTAVSVDSSGYTHITPAVTVGVSYTSSTPPTNGAIIQGKTSIGSDLTPTAQLGITAAASTNPFSATTATGDNVYVDTSGDVHIQSTTPTSATLYVKGNAIGASYSGSSTAPTNGAIIQGNVGIGTTSPDVLVEAAKSGLGSTTTFAEVARIGDVDNNRAVSFGTYNGQASIEAVRQTDGLVARDLHINPDGPSANVFISEEGGVVGIGTSTTSAQLGITAAASTNPFSATTATGDNVYVDTSGDVHIQSTTPTSATLYVKGNAASTGFYIQSDVNKDAYVWQAENRGMYIGTNNSTRMSLDSSGNVGIGTASPSAPLTVIGYSRTGSTSDGVQLSTEAGFGRIIGIDIDGSAYNGLKFFASATEAVTIDTSGNVKVEGGTFDTNITSTGDLYTGAAGAVDYSTTTINGTTCDITGGSGGSGGVIVKRIGKTVFVEYYIIFTESNSTNVTFTIPYTPQATPGGFSHYVHGSFAREGATYLANPPTCSFASTGKTVTCYKNGNDGVFATSGLKFVSGQFFYETSE